MALEERPKWFRYANEAKDSGSLEPGPIPLPGFVDLSPNPETPPLRDVESLESTGALVEEAPAPALTPEELPKQEATGAESPSERPGFRSTTICPKCGRESWTPYKSTLKGKSGQEYSYTVYRHLNPENPQRPKKCNVRIADSAR